MQRSSVKWFDAKKGYGFINHPEGGDDVFVHYSQIISDKDFKTLRTGQEVKFEMNDGPKGLHALDVKPLAEEEDASEERRDEPATAEETATTEETATAEETATKSSSEDSASSDGEENNWESEWNEEEWTDEHGNPPDPMAGPSF